MANIFDYLQWRGDLPFARDPLNPVDALIFSTLAYISYSLPEEGEQETVTLRQASEQLFFGEILDHSYRVKNDLNLLRHAADTERFGNTRLCMCQERFVPEQDTQFAAMTFLLDDGTAVLSFRGTDYSLVGWKEDFNMSFQQVVPAQRLAAEYINEVAGMLACPLRLCGHSKGGNLAVYAGARCTPEVRARIIEVYNNDGPGFMDTMMKDPGYQQIVPKVRTLVPQSSVIGMLLEHEEPYTVIRSNSVGVMQHDPYSWELMGNQFIPAAGITRSSVVLDTAIKTWFAERTDQERNQLVDVMFTLLSSGTVDKATDIFLPKNIGTYLKTLRGDEALRKMLSTEFLSLMDAVKKAMTDQGKSLEEPAETLEVCP